MLWREVQYCMEIEQFIKIPEFANCVVAVDFKYKHCISRNVSASFKTTERSLTCLTRKRLSKQNRREIEKYECTIQGLLKFSSV